MEQSNPETSVERKTWTVADFENLRQEADRLQKLGPEFTPLVPLDFADIETLADLLGGSYKAWRAGRLDQGLYHLMLSKLNYPQTMPIEEKYATAWIFAELLAPEKSVAPETVDGDSSATGSTLDESEPATSSDTETQEKKTWTLTDFENLRLEADELQK